MAFIQQMSMDATSPYVDTPYNAMTLTTPINQTTAPQHHNLYINCSPMQMLSANKSLDQMVQWVWSTTTKKTSLSLVQPTREPMRAKGAGSSPCKIPRNKRFGS